MKRYSKRVREEAALICAIAASTPGLRDAYSAVVSALRGLPRPAHTQVALFLALDAWNAAHAEDCNGPRDALAEALIRSGWSGWSHP